MKFPFWFKLLYKRDQKIHSLEKEIKRLSIALDISNKENNIIKNQLELYKEMNFEKDSIKG